MKSQIESLREALQYSPDNIPLRLHLAETLYNEQQYEEAEEEFKFVLELSGDNVKAKYGLVHTYYYLSNYSTAIVIAEELIAHYTADASIYKMYAKLMVKEGEIDSAVENYQKAQVLEPGLRDDELDQALLQHNYQSSSGDDFDEEPSFDSQFMLEKPTTNFSNVGGMESVKEEIRIKIISPLKFPELYKAYGKKAGGGILLYGPPGCGKTHLARATAGEVNAKFICVGINQIMDMYIGNSEKNLHNLFEIARRNAPCVLFFDEVDALGASRSDMKQSAGRQLINQFLSELDGIDASNEGVLILAATNAPWHLDPAFRRPGRFDRIVFIQPPDQEARVSILRILLEGKPVKDIDYKDLASRTKEFSGADLQNAIDITIEDKLRESFSSGVPKPIENKDLVKAIQKMNSSTKDWFVSARNYALYANESGLYDDILKYLNIKK